MDFKEFNIEEQKLRFSLPFPPTINNYWLQVGRRRVLTKSSRLFKDEAGSRVALLCVLVPDSFRMRLKQAFISRHMAVYPPDKRRRDGTNLEKAVDDVLVYGGLIVDDSQIKRWSGEMLAPDPNYKKGYVIVELSLI